MKNFVGELTSCNFLNKEVQKLRNQICSITFMDDNRAEIKSSVGGFKTSPIKQIKKSTARSCSIPKIAGMDLLANGLKKTKSILRDAFLFSYLKL